MPVAGQASLRSMRSDCRDKTGEIQADITDRHCGGRSVDQKSTSAVEHLGVDGLSERSDGAAWVHQEVNIHVKLPRCQFHSDPWRMENDEGVW